MIAADEESESGSHYSVLLRESLEYLAIQPDGVYVDATAGLGGHALAIAQLLRTGFVIACDRDAESLDRAKSRVGVLTDRVRFHHGPFSALSKALAAEGVSEVNGMLADLGVSRYQLTAGERGFSLMADGPLDMRMDRSLGITAADLVNELPEKELADLLFQLGEERRSRRISRAIVRARPIFSTSRLAQVVESAVPRTGRIHPATQTFMALRLKVNEEAQELAELLREVPGRLKSGGRFVVLTFMSTEDRMVKRSFLEESRAGKFRILTRHVVRPGREEVLENPASRSAKLRAAERV